MVLVKNTGFLNLAKKTRIVVLGLMAVWLNGQQPSREYVRLGGRVIAIENTTPSIVISPVGATLGSLDTLQFTASCGGCTPTWSVDNQTFADITPTGGLLTPHQWPHTVQVTATAEANSNSTTVNIVPVPSPINPVDGQFPASGGTGTIAVTKAGTWTGHSNAGWIHFVSPTPDGSGNISATGPL